MKMSLTLAVAVAALALSACGGGEPGSGSGETALERAEVVSEKVGATEVVEITEDNDPNDLLGRPNGYESAAVIYDDRVECDGLGVECGATMETWESEDAAEERSEYILEILEASPALGSEYHYRDGATLLRVWGDLKPSEAEEYEAAFN